MAGDFRVWRVEPASPAKSADFPERAANSRRVARELHRRRVSQPIAVAARNTKTSGSVTKRNRLFSPTSKAFATSVIHATLDQMNSNDER